MGQPTFMDYTLTFLVIFSLPILIALLSLSKKIQKQLRRKHVLS